MQFSHLGTVKALKGRMCTLDDCAGGCGTVSMQQPKNSSQTGYADLRISGPLGMNVCGDFFLTAALHLA
jgi:hypothetical protein